MYYNGWRNEKKTSQKINEETKFMILCLLVVKKKIKNKSPTKNEIVIKKKGKIIKRNTLGKVQLRNYLTETCHTIVFIMQSLLTMGAIIYGNLIMYVGNSFVKEFLNNLNSFFYSKY